MDKKEIKEKIKNILWQESPKALALTYLVMLVFVLIFALFFFKLYLPFTTDYNDYTKVPNVVGKTSDQAMSQLKEAGLKPFFKDTVYLKSKVPFTIVRQSPENGEEVKFGSGIALTYNTNKGSLIPVNKEDAFLIFHKDKSSARTYLTNKGFTVDNNEKYIEGKFPNTVEKIIIGGKQYSSEDFQSGELKLESQYRIKLVVVKDEGAERKIVVPNVVGMSYLEAEELLSKTGFIVHVTSVKDPSKEDFEVLEQDLVADEEVPENTLIELTVVHNEE